MLTTFLSTLSLVLLCACTSPNREPDRPSTTIPTASVIDTCDNPDAPIACCFEHMPATPGSAMTIAGPNEPGELLVISGTIYKADSTTPYPRVLVYAYHTDAHGLYSKKGNERGFQKWHGYLHGWCCTDESGRYEIHTIRPAPYPTNTMPAHIHAVLREPDGRSKYISDFVFADDTLVNARHLSGLEGLIGGTGVVDVTKGGDGVWRGERDIVLGR